MQGDETPGRPINEKEWEKLHRLYAMAHSQREKISTILLQRIEDAKGTPEEMHLRNERDLSEKKYRDAVKGFHQAKNNLLAYGNGKGDNRVTLSYKRPLEDFEAIERVRSYIVDTYNFPITQEEEQNYMDIMAETKRHFAELKNSSLVAGSAICIHCHFTS